MVLPVYSAPSLSSALATLEAVDTTDIRKVGSTRGVAPSIAPGTTVRV